MAELTKRNRWQVYAHKVVWTLIHLGAMEAATTMTCFDCGSHAREYHHFMGYQKPLHVLPLCRSCHFKREPRYRKKKLFLVVSDIRNSIESNYVLAKKYGVHWSVIAKIRSGHKFRMVESTEKRLSGGQG